MREADLVVIGGGIAGLSGALAAADEGAEVVVLTKGPLLSSNSYFAQGGVAAALALVLFCMYVGLYHGLFGLLLAVVAFGTEVNLRG